MKLLQKNGLSWYQFDHLTRHGVVHGTLTRKGGFSKELFEGLNLSYKSGDNPDRVVSNRKLVTETFPSIDAFVVGNLVHGATISELNDASLGWSHCERRADGLITDRKDVALCMTHADCQVALFYDPKQQLIASVHSGWRGSVQNIYKEVSISFKEKGSNLSDILVGISPSLGPSHAEFIHYKTELPKKYWSFEEKKSHFNFWAISLSQLLDLGFSKENIEIAKICTYENREDFYSYRRDKATGRNLSFIAL